MDDHTRLEPVIEVCALAAEEVAGGTRYPSSRGGIFRNGHRLTRNGLTWTCTRCHEPAPEPDDYGRMDCVPDEEDQHDMH